MSQLTVKQELYLKTKAQGIKPVVTISYKGITENIIKEINANLIAHELIKIKIIAEKDLINPFIDEIITKTNAIAIERIGKMLVLYKRSIKNIISFNKS